jgi:II/X family phage/plasmid replication protein
MKFYNKYREITARGKTHEIPEHLKDYGLDQFIQGKLRAELRLFSKELQKHDITHGYHLSPEKIQDLFNLYMGKIDMTNNATLIDEKLLKLPRTVQSTYQLWRQGADLRSLMPKNTFYRHRRILMQSGVDINMPCQSPEQNNVIPLYRVIEAKPVDIPRWAYEKGLIAA